MALSGVLDVKIIEEFRSAIHKVITEKFATFACTPDLQKRRPPATTSTPGFYLAGDYTAGDYPATLEGAARSGIGAASLATTYLTQSIRS